MGSIILNYWNSGEAPSLIEFSTIHRNDSVLMFAVGNGTT